VVEEGGGTYAQKWSRGEGKKGLIFIHKPRGGTPKISASGQKKKKKKRWVRRKSLTGRLIAT